MSKILQVHASMTVEQTCKQPHLIHTDTSILHQFIYDIHTVSLSFTGRLISETLNISNPDAYGLYYAITSSSGSTSGSSSG